MSALAISHVATTLLPGLQFAIGVNSTFAVATGLLVAIFLCLPTAAATKS